jgi:branched-chain amino acid aminotransferase
VIVWINGELVPLERRRVSPLDHGLVVGDGVFETLRVYRGVPFAWTRHLERLRASADGLGLARPTPSAARRGRRRARANGCRGPAAHHRDRAGPAPPGSSAAAVPPTVIVVAFELEPRRRPPTS